MKALSALIMELSCFYCIQVRKSRLIFYQHMITMPMHALHWPKQQLVLQNIIIISCLCATVPVLQRNYFCFVPGACGGGLLLVLFLYFWVF